MSNAFLTGSHVYGTLREGSDIDVCVLLSADDRERLSNLAPWSDGEDEYDGSDGSSIRFGKLNLICFSNPAAFNAWKEATDELIAAKPVSRELAVDLITEKLKRARDASEDQAFATACVRVGMNDVDSLFMG